MKLAVVSPNPNVYVFELHKDFEILQGLYLLEIGLYRHNMFFFTTTRCFVQSYPYICLILCITLIVKCDVT